MDITLIDARTVKTLLPERKTDSHKGDYGRVHIVGGSRRYSGAVRLCIRAALRGGAGLVSAHVPQCIWAVTASDTCEAMTEGLPEDGSGRFSFASFAQIEDRLKTADGCALGPGIGRGGDIPALVKRTLESASCPVVLDADGINAFAEHIHPLTACPCVLTPHDGEFIRLMEAARLKSCGDRAGETLALARELDCVIVRKGPGTLTAEPGGRVLCSTAGNPGMASGGMGDALTGLIAALIGQGLAPFDAACAGVWLHGRAGDICAQRLSQQALLPSDVINAFGEAFLELGRISCS